MARHAPYLCLGGLYNNGAGLAKQELAGKRYVALQPHVAAVLRRAGACDLGGR